KSNEKCKYGSPVINSSKEICNKPLSEIRLSILGKFSPNSHLEIDWREIISDSASCSCVIPFFLRYLIILSAKAIFLPLVTPYLNNKLFLNKISVITVFFQTQLRCACFNSKLLP